MSIFSIIKNKSNQKNKNIFVLIDPDKFFKSDYNKIVNISNKSDVSLFLIGGSIITTELFEKTILYIKENSKIPVCIFPGSVLQISKNADAMLFLSLISGRNPEFLIGNHVQVSPILKNYNIEIIPTGYILVDGGNKTAVQYMSNTSPVPSDKPEIAAATALAGEYLGMDCIFMDAGSGAQKPISANYISVVKSYISLPVIVGGGIKTQQQVDDAIKGGADAVVIGNAIEKNPELLLEICK